MTRFALLASLALALPAEAAILQSNIQHPAAPATGPKSLVAVRVDYGTCNGNSFGIWEGGKTLPMPTSQITFDIPYRRTCTRAYWQQRNGKWIGPSAVDIAEAP